jgi:hypothetical protein
VAGFCLPAATVTGEVAVAVATGFRSLTLTYGVDKGYWVDPGAPGVPKSPQNPDPPIK